ncbi:hypothetical protein [Salinimicrobium gaetbulicola]|uniref:Adhesin n=1 Tax=Salinimicrobium gaetbulicola TaxID=999702 RepID=A0ABW3IJD4_9FLAO
MKIIKLNYLLVWLLSCASVFAQTKKLDKTFKTNADVTLNIDATHTNIEVEHWDKNEVQVQAYMELKGMDKEEMNRILKNWDLRASGNGKEVVVKSSGGMTWNGNIDMTAFEESLSKLPEIISPIQEMIGPMLESISGNPLPPEFYENMGDLHFDYEAYRKDGDKYLEKFEKKIEKNFGEDFEKSMEEWASKFENDSAIWKNKVIVMKGDKFEKEMEAWGEEFGKSMEAWGEQFGKEMETWAQNLEKEVETKYKKSDGKTIILRGDDLKAKKTIRIKIPKNGSVKLNVRHGDVKMAGNVKNLRGDLAHGSFTANTISGEKTYLKVAYTPVKVKQWNYGMLKASYIQELHIDKAVSIKLTSNSSDVVIKELVDQGILRGTFGELVIDKLGNDFKSLDIVLENSDLKLDLPEVAYNFQYTGTKSKVKFPDRLKLKSSKSYDTQKLNGFNQSKNANASISISANFSDVLLK